MTAHALRLRLRLFVEGVELPVISAQVQVNPNSPMVASIQIPPLAEATRFLPRSIIHLFFFDFYEDYNPNIQKTGASVYSPPGPSVYQQQIDKADTVGGVSDATEAADVLSTQYKLLFAGELMGFQWTKSATNRALVLQCSDFSNYWDYCYQYNNTDLFGPGIKAMFSGGSTNLFTDFLSTPGEAVTRIILTPSVRYPKLEGLQGGIVHLLEAMGGSYYYDKKFAGQNIFFSIAELRLHLTQMITAYAHDKTSKKLLGGGYDSLFGRSIGNLGEQASFRKVINMLQGVIFHEMYGQPCPMYVPGTNGTVSGGVQMPLSKMDVFGGLCIDARNMTQTLQALLSSLSSTAGQPSTQTMASTISDALQRLGTMQQTCNNDAQKASAAAPAAAKAGNQQIAKVGQQVSAYFKTAGTQIGTAITKFKATKTGSGTAKGGSVNSSVTNAINQAITTLQKINGLTVQTTSQSNQVPSILNQQILRPDVWFSAPPRCNVLFPDQYSSLQYSRSFMQEPTRLLLKTSDTFFGEDELFDHFYFAPKAITLKQQANTLQAILKGDILDHELFTGILPVFEKMGEFNIFAARSGVTDAKTPKIGLAQRSTNFLYFKYRFAARQMQITAKFNPYIACGFPGLVVDKYVDLETLRIQRQLQKSLPSANGQPPPELLQLLGTHFLGNFTEVTHQVDQRQGTTMINCSYARQPEETVEFLGNVQGEVDLMKKTGGPPAVVTTTVAAITAPRLNSAGPAGGRITGVLDVTSAYAASDFNSGFKLPLFNGDRDDGTSKQITTRVPVGLAATADQYGPEVQKAVGDSAGPPHIVVTFKAFEVTESVDRTQKQTVQLPPEEYIRPGWYGDCWHPSKISEVYYDFFNTGAITEPQQISNVDASNPSGSFPGGTQASSDPTATLADAANQQNPLTFAQDQLIALALTQGASIQQAVSYLVLAYTVIKQAGYDTDQFIRSYTWRPIASALDMFGTSDLQLDAQGKDVVQGIEGFHSRAFGQFSTLYGLATPDIESIVGIQVGSTQAAKADTRKRKQDAVLAYVSQLAVSKAILG